MVFTQEEKDSFIELSDSLKKYRRAELTDEQGNDLIDTLYTDLLPNDFILKQTLKSNTTFLVGRKGTGKSTIFLKLQREIRKNNKSISCYIDTKTVFESSRSQDVNIDYLSEYLPTKLLEKYLLERTFIQNVLKEIRKEIDKRSVTILERIKMSIGQDKSDIVKEKLLDLQNRIENNQELRKIELPLIQKVVMKLSDGAEKSTSSSVEAPSDNFLKVFQIKEIIVQIKEILSLLGINSIFVLLDDFSEIDDNAIRTFIDTVVAPLNNWSEEFIKLKIAAYPNRIYYGKIDKGKVDILDLDFFNLYSQVNRDEMEERAVNFTKRLVEKRVQHFTKKNAEFFFDVKKETMDDYYQLLFQVSMNVPRIMGYILYYCGESSISYDKPITRSVIHAAAQRYYDKNIESFFDTTTYSLMSYDEKISVLQLKELLDSFVKNLGTIKRKITTGELKGLIYEGVRNNPYSTHFYLMPLYEEFIKTLELNFFLTKYNEMSDRDGGKQSVYCLNYGLALKNNLRWGKPRGREYRKYFISRPFNFNMTLDRFLKESKIIKCINPKCNKHFPFEQLEFFKFTKMKCPECHNPVKIISTSEKIRKQLDKIDKSVLLPKMDFSLLHEINKDGQVRPKDVAQELDCSYQLIMWKAKKLDENSELVSRDQDEGHKRVYRLTKKAKNTYFSEKDE